MQQEFEAGTGEVWPLNDGQVYGTLQRLERSGLVDSSEGPGAQRLYELTDAGSAELADWLETPPAMATPPRDDLVIKVLIALMLGDVDVHDLVQVHRRKVVEVMQSYTRLRGEAAEDEVGLGLAVDAELFRLDGLVRWLDSVDETLARLPRTSSKVEPQRVPGADRLRRQRVRQ